MYKDLDDEVQKLIKQFHGIAMKKWIRSVDKGLGSIGYTFEKELNKSLDCLYFPDYYGTEIKCTGRYSRYPITLFTTAFDGPTFPEINRIIDKYGYPDSTYPNKKVIFANISCIDKKKIASGYQFKLDVDDIEEKIYLCVYDVNNNLIERKSFVYFNTLYNHLCLKLNKLALIYASKKEIDGVKHFRYYKIGVYRLKGFDKFLELLRSGVLEVDLIARISKSGEDAGRHRNKNLVFKIKKDNIGELFDEMYVYDYDSTYI